MLRQAGSPSVCIASSVEDDLNSAERYLLGSALRETRKNEDNTVQSLQDSESSRYFQRASDGLDSPSENCQQ